jgi:hypothetical protein
MVVRGMDGRKIFNDKDPFWRQTGLSGYGFSKRGPMGELHDGSNNGQGPYGLTGIVGIPAVHRNHQQLLTEAILSQLAMIYGKPAAQPTAVFQSARGYYRSSNLCWPKKILYQTIVNRNVF